MIRTIKRVLLSALSILGISFLVWTTFLLNPSLSYANQTQIDQVTVFHNDLLQEGTETIVRSALAIIKKSDLYDANLNIQLCMNDDKHYPNLHPTPGGTAYAFFNKTIIYACKPDFKNNRAEFSWAFNNYESRKFDLTYLLAHEFTHNLQSNHDTKSYVTKTFNNINWKFEGHADYVSRQFQNDGLLKSKIDKYLLEKDQEHHGHPVMDLPDGTKQILSYYKYALVYQYLKEIKDLNFKQICALDASIESPYSQMIEWHKQNKISK